MTKASAISASSVVLALLLASTVELHSATESEILTGTTTPNAAARSTYQSQTIDEYGLIPEIRGNRSLERTFVDAKVEKIATLSEGDEYMLYNPGIEATLSDNRLYFYDFGDHTVKAFTSQGEYIATYGEGEGRGPGELTSMMDIGTWQDSLVYIVDQRQRRTSFFDRDDGEFVRTESYDLRMPRYQLAWAKGGIKYTMPNPRPGLPFLTIETQNRQLAVSSVASGNIHPLALQGHLKTHGEKAIIVPDYLPVILAYSPQDTAGIAYPTPDYGKERPKAQKYESRASAPDWSFNQEPKISEGVLSVGIPDKEENRLLFDLYDLKGMEYMYTLRLPIIREDPLESERSFYAHGPGIVVSVTDATVEIHRVQLPEN